MEDNICPHCLGRDSYNVMHYENGFETEEYTCQYCYSNGIEKTTKHVKKPSKLKPIDIVVGSIRNGKIGTDK